MFLGIAIGISIVLVYAFVVRPILKTAPALAPAFAAEASLRQKIQAKITGWKTKITARLLIIAGIVSGLYNDLVPLISTQDWSPLTAKIPAWTVPIGLVVVGYVFERLRRATENPPSVIVQKDADGVAKIVAVDQPVKA